MCSGVATGSSESRAKPCVRSAKGLRSAPWLVLMTRHSYSHHSGMEDNAEAEANAEAAEAGGDGAYLAALQPVRRSIYT